MTHKLTKSAFLDYRACSKSLWLRHNRPDAIDWPAPGSMVRMLMRDGYAVETQVRELVKGWPDPHQLSFQRVFDAASCYARADLVREHADGSLDIYEIKGSTSLKSSSGDDHIDDVGFQVAVARMLGLVVRSAHIIHVNGDYVRSGPVLPSELLKIVDVTSEIEDRREALAVEIASAIALLGTPEIDEQGCSCRLLGSVDRHCASFDYFNQDLVQPTAHCLPRISRPRLSELDKEGRLSIHDVTEDDVTASQLPILRALQTGEPVINRPSIQAFLGKLSWPLFFYDYETFASAIPLADGYRPQQKMPVQFSLHRLDKDGGIAHFEFLADAPGQEEALVLALRDAVGETGSAVVWNEGFEKSCNRILADLLPEHAGFLEQLNRRTVDLMVPFKADYVHPDFCGSTSIKNVLPVLCPHLQYPKDAVHDGTSAMEAWIEMIETTDVNKRSQLKSELLAYCHLDSLAMVEIYQVLTGL